MFKFFTKKKKYTIINCNTDEVLINGHKLMFPTNYNTLIETFGKPSRELQKSKNYMFWDALGIVCAYNSAHEILSINFYQNNKIRNEYNTKQQFTGGLFCNSKNITNKEFSKISLGKVAIHRLGSESEIRFGFSLGVNNDYIVS